MAQQEKNPPANAGDSRRCWFNLWVRKTPLEEENGNPLQ